MNGRALFLALIAAMAMTGPAVAGVIRHDVSDSVYLSLGADPRFASVGQIKGKTSSFGFSAAGTLIASNWMLTAAHVVDRAVSLDFKLAGGTYTAAEWFTFPDWNGSLSSGYDIALVRFDMDVVAASGVAAAERFTGSSEVGKTGVSVGFGRTGTGLTGATTFDQKKRAGQNVIDLIMTTPGDPDRILLSDFNRPGVTTESSMGSKSPVAREYMIAAGDSGGGLFVPYNSQFWLAGVHSFGYGAKDGVFNADYGDASGHTRVSVFNGWIDGIIQGWLNGTSSSGLVRTAGLVGLVAIEVPEPALLPLMLCALALAATLRFRTTSGA